MRPDASMTLLTEVMDRPLDPGYAAAVGTARPGAWRAGGVGVLAVVLGLVGTVAALGLRAPRGQDESVREILTQQIVARQAGVETAQDEVGVLTEQIAALRADGLVDRAGGFRESVRRDGVVTGLVAVSGPGLVVTMADGRQRVLDLDVQMVVNALWAGGAEAVAINGHRLTSLSAIRSAGQAVLVDLEPLSSPYQISAIGDGEAMRVALLRTGVSDQLRLLEAQFGIRSSVTGQAVLELPGSGGVGLRYARAAGEP